MIKLMVDSSSDCEANDGLFDLFVPITVTLDGKEYADGMDPDKDTFYDLLTHTASFPSTSQPSPQTFLDIFEKVKESGDDVIYFALSSALSGTYQSALMAKEMADYDRIHIIDTRAATHLIGILVRHAAGLRDAGHSAPEIVKQCEELKNKIKAFAVADTLEYLRRGGRLSGASAAIGTLAQIKPTLTVTPEGKVENIGKSIGKGKAIRALLDHLAARELDERFPLCTLYTCGEDNCTELEEKLSNAGYPVSSRLQIGSTIGAHLGPGLFGILFVEK